MRDSNKRIAKNTLLIYTQVIVQTIVGLISARIVLQTLGVSDFGLYGVVGGVVSMFSFISGALSNTTSRFLNYEMGKKNGDVNHEFNISHVLHLIAALLIFVLCQIVGLYYIQDYLVVAPEKEGDALFVFELSLAISCLGIINIPFKAVLIAFERFKLIACIEIVNTLFKFILVVCLFYYQGNALRFYAICMCGSSLFLLIVYHYIGIKKWPDIVRWKFENKISSYREQLSFGNWSLLGVAAVSGRSQGSHILINYFFGTIANAAYSISLTVQNYVNILADNFSKSAIPQITQLIGKGRIDEATALVVNISRFHLLLTELVFFALYVELDFLLHLWLGNSVPQETLDFCKLTLVVAVISATGSGIVTLISAYGNLKWFKIQTSLWLLSCLPIGYIVFLKGYPSYSILFLYVYADIGNRISQLILLKKQYNFPIRYFLYKSWLRPLIVMALMVVYLCLYPYLGFSVAWSRIFGVILTILVTCMFIIFVGIHPSEREMLYLYIKKHERC